MQTAPTLWLRNDRFDLLFFVVSGWLSLGLIVPYVLWGDQAVFPVYNFYLVFFGLPHNYLTWSTLLPRAGRQAFDWPKIGTAALAIAAVILIIPFTQGTELNHWILTLITHFSLWHAYRQHHGICKVYDAVQSRRTGDTTIFTDRYWLNLFFGLSLYGVMVWAFSHPGVVYRLSTTDAYPLIYPLIPRELGYVYGAFTVLVGALAIKQSLWDRKRAGKFIPWPQLALMATAIVTYYAPYFFVPLDAMPLAVAIATIYHNVQYFGFVWLYERHRSHELAEAKRLPLALPQRLAHQGAWLRFYGLGLLYSFAIIAIYGITPNAIGLTLIYYVAFAHYVIDGYIWRRDGNKDLGTILGRMAQAPT